MLVELPLALPGSTKDYTLLQIWSPKKEILIKKIQVLKLGIVSCILILFYLFQFERVKLLFVLGFLIIYFMSSVQ